MGLPAVPAITEADIVVYNRDDRRIAAIIVMRAGSEEELPVLAEKAFYQLKDNTECDLVKRNGAVWRWLHSGAWLFTKSAAFSWPADALLRHGSAV